MRPSGRKTGHTWANSPDVESIEVTGVATPPAERTCIKGPLPVAKTMAPSRPHAAPSPTTLASQRVLGTPVATETLFNLPSATYPIEAPSGDQNGRRAPSVCSNSRIVRERKLRTPRSCLPNFRLKVTVTIALPSGDGAASTASVGIAPSVTENVNDTASASELVGRLRVAVATKSASNTALIAQGAHRP